MNNYEWQKTNDESFEKALEQIIPEPSGTVVSEITPWKKSMNRVLTGLALEIITLNFYCLNYILPTVGTILKLLGFRTLKYENKWFKACYFISVILALFRFSSLILNATIIQSAYNSSSVGAVVKFIISALFIIQIICLWRAFLAVQRKAELPEHANGAAALIAVSIITELLALIEFQGFFIPIALIIGYIFIIRSLYKLSKDISEAGYVICTKPIKITDRYIVISIVAVLIIGLLCGYTFGNSYPMEWMPQEKTEHESIQKIKSDLISLGFPENILNDINAEDIEACEGASQVIVKKSDNKVNCGLAKITDKLTDSSAGSDSSAGNLCITSIGVRISAEQDSWMMFHHFFWNGKHDFFGTEAVQIQPPFSDNYYYPAANATGRVLYDINGKTFISDYDYIGTKTYRHDSIFFGSNTRNDIFATFSIPKNSEKQRGYVAYSINEINFGRVICSYCNYIHQSFPFPYPSVTAMEYAMNDYFNSSNSFTVIQEQFLIHPEEVITE